MKRILLTGLIVAATVCAHAQQKKPDTALYQGDRKNLYTINEADIALIDNFLVQYDVLAGNSDKVSTAQYNSIHRGILKMDSVIRVQYVQKHPPQQPKVENKEGKNP